MTHKILGQALALVAALVLAHRAAAATREGYEIYSFIEPGGYLSARLSPDGKRVALVSRRPDSSTEIVIVDLLSLTSRGLSPKVIESSEKELRGFTLRQTTVQNPSGVHWVDNGSLAVDFVRNPSWHVNLASADGVYDWSYEGRYLGTVRLSGQATREALVASLSDGVIRRKPAGAGELQPIGSGLPGGEVIAWRQDKSGLIRIATLLSAKPEGSSKRLQTWYRRDDAAPWTLIDDRGINEDVFEGAAVTENPDEILVLSRNGGDHIGVWRFDVVQRKLLEQVASRPEADVTLIENAEEQDGVAQVRTEGLLRQTIWFDDRMKRLQTAVDATLADHVNFLESSGSQRILVESRSDTDPGQLYVLDANSMSMQPVGTRRPSIDRAKMHPMQMLWYTAPDGHPIPAYLTLPGKPNKPVPLVVLVHGGPQVRDHWEWNEEVQILAGNGYGVFQPQFRGSAGFGKRHQEAGYGQWGLAMQDDITAGVKWLVDQHIADPNRICIVGSSYGGYAALWGLEKTPELYKCGVSVAGVTDIEREFTTDSDVTRSETALEVVRQRVGDPALMKVALDEVSPVKHADRIRVPVLLVHGLLDERVPVVQGRMMRDALQARQASVVWLQFNDEAHGISHTYNLFNYYRATLNLLSGAIGRGERASAASVAP